MDLLAVEFLEPDECSRQMQLPPHPLERFESTLDHPKYVILGDYEKKNSKLHISLY
jgi:hypothetical protein